MSSYKDEIVTYQVTLKGYWEDPQKRLWKSGRDIYHVDMNNNAKLIQEEANISFPITKNDVNDVNEEDIENELDALFEQEDEENIFVQDDEEKGEGKEEKENPKRGYYDLDPPSTLSDSSNKKSKTI